MVYEYCFRIIICQILQRNSLLKKKKSLFILIIKLLVKDQDHQKIGNRPKHFNFPHKITKLSALKGELPI